MEDENKIMIVKIVVIALVILVIPATIIYAYQEREVEISIKKEIERGIEVKDIENKFIEHICFGGAGGLGAPEIKCKNANQFIELVEPNETIYIDFEVVRYDFMPLGSTGSRLEKTYWAFIENRAGIMSYTDTTCLYVEKPDSFWFARAFNVKSHDSDSVVFVKGNCLTVFGLLILIEAIILVFGSVTASKIRYDEWIYWL